MNAYEMSVLSDWVPDAWVIEEMRKEQEEAHRRPRPYVEVPLGDHERQEESSKKTPSGGTVIIIEL